MTNTENQKRLDRKKWTESQKAGEDLSGKMFYCDGCKYQKMTSFGETTYCVVPHERRVEEEVCSTSYNRVVRKSKKKD